MPADTLTACLKLFGCLFSFEASGAFLWAWRTGHRIPVLGRLRDYARQTTFASTLALLLRRQVPLPTALALAGRTSDVAAQGGSLTESLRDTFDPTLLWLIESADGSGEAARALDDVAKIYRRRLDRAVERTTTVLVPLAELVVGVVVFVCAYSFVLPLYRAASEVLWW